MTDRMQADVDSPPLSHAVELLGDSGFFAGLDIRQRQRIALLSEMQQFRAGAAVYRPGEQARFLYLVGSGIARLAVGYGVRQAPAGDLLRRGEVFGWAALTPNVPLRIGTATCLTDCLLVAIDGAALLHAFEEDHSLGYRLTTQLNRLITGTITSFAGG